MMEYLSIAADLLKWLLLISSLAAAVIMAIAIFHPVRFRVRLRASILGQRAEIWGSYLFGILNLGVIATPNVQDVTIKIFCWKKLLQRTRRISATVSPEKPEQQASQTPDKKNEAAPTTATTADQETVTVSRQDKTVTETAAVEEEADEAQKETVLPAKPPLEPEPSSEPSPTKAEEPVIDKVQPAEIKPVQTKPSEAYIEPDGAAMTPPAAEPPQAVPVDTVPLEPLHKTDEKPKAKPTATETASESQKEPVDNWRSMARKFRRDFSRRYRQLKNYLKLFGQKWQILSPVLKRFWARGKQGFRLHEPTLKLRYALHEPYITGMFHGSMSILAGLANRFGLNFIPVPSFNEPGVYARGQVTAIIRPWKFMAALLGLAFEKDLYKEAWAAFKWYRLKRQQT